VAGALLQSNAKAQTNHLAMSARQSVRKAAAGGVSPCTQRQSCNLG